MKRFTENELIDAMGEIDDKFIIESERQTGFSAVLKYSSAVAACLAFALLTGVALYSASKRDEAAKPPIITQVSTVHSSSDTESSAETTFLSTDSSTESTTEAVTETETESESETTVTESETTVIYVPTPPTEPEPTEPEPPPTEPVESTTPKEPDVPLTESDTASPTETPVAPSESETDEPVESTAESSDVTTADISSSVKVTEDDKGAIDDVTEIITEMVPQVGVTTPATAVPTSPAWTTGTGQEATEAPVTSSPKEEEPKESDYAKYYTGKAPVKGNSSSITAYYLTRIPNSFCVPESTDSSSASKVFDGCTDIFSGNLVSLSSAEITLYGDKRFYVSILEVKISGDILRNSGKLSENKTVRILLPHGVNISDEGLYDARDIAGLLGETELIVNGFGMFCVEPIGNKKISYKDQYYSLSALADYVIEDGMNDLILSNGYYTFFNEKTYAELTEVYGKAPTMSEVTDYFNECKKNGII